MDNMKITMANRIRSSSGKKYVPYAVVDIETSTDFSAENQHICAIAVCRSLPDGRLEDPVSFLVRPPGNEISPETTKVHRITPEMTRDKPEFKEIWRVVEDHIEDRMLLAHNADFDFRIIEQEIKNNDITLQYDRPYLYSCTLDMARAALPHEEGYGLSNLARKFGIDLDHHNPASDAAATAQLLIQLMSIQKRKNPLSLAKKLGVAVGMLGYPPRWKHGLRPREKKPHFKKVNDKWLVCAPPGVLQEGGMIEIALESGDISYLKLGKKMTTVKASAGGILECVLDFTNVSEREYDEWVDY